MLKKLAYLELWVDDANSVALSYEKNFGFTRIAEANPETGLFNHVSIALQQGNAKLIITSSLKGQGVVADFVQKHGDGVRDIAFLVDDASDAFDKVVAAGARICSKKTIHTFGDVVHTLVDSEELPAYFSPVSTRQQSNATFFLEEIDHVAICLAAGELDKVVDFYTHVLGFKELQAEYVETEYSGMNSKVLSYGSIKFPLQEPLLHNATGPISEFLQLNKGAGVYHVAFLSKNIYQSIRALPDAVKVLNVPDAYYEQLPERLTINEPLNELKALQVLVDGDSEGYLMQVFTRSLHPRKTFYVELIQRVSYYGFGSGNVRALFKAIESDRIQLQSIRESS